MQKILTLFLFFYTVIIYSQVVPISELKQNNSNGLPVNLGDTVTVIGTVTASNNFGANGPGAIQDTTAGISVYGNSFAGQVEIGDSVTITAKVDQFNGLTQLNFTLGAASLINHGNTTVPEPEVVTINEVVNQQWNGFEAIEGKLIRINNVTISGSGNFSGGTSGQNYPISDPTGTMEIRIDESVNLVGTPIPTDTIDIIGVLGQYDPVTPYSSGYQLFPRFVLDIINSIQLPVILTPVYASNIDTNSFTVYFNTARNGNSQVKYGLTPALELDSVVIDTDTTEHAVPVTGLNPFTLYYFKAYSSNEAGTSSSELYSVRTSSANPSPGNINVYFNFPVDTTVAIPGNSAQGNVDVESKLIERINQATHSIDLALYSFFGVPDVADAIVAAKNRGVKVRVVYDHREGGALQNSMQTLANAGILISRRPNETSTFHGIMHNKFFVFDARDTIEANDWVWTGSLNITSTELGWKNNVVEVNDPSIASAYTIEFEEMWGSNNEIPNPSNARFGNQKLDNTPHTFNIGGRDVGLYFSPSDGTTSKINNQIGYADHSIYMALYVITRDDIRQAIITQTGFGMDDLRGIVDQINSQGSEFSTLGNYGEMLQNVSPTLHHKYAIFDAPYSESAPATITGSHNWSSAAEEDNDENTLIIQDVYIANQYMQEFKKRYNEAGGTGTFIIPVLNAEEEYITDFSFQLYQNYPNPFNPVTTIRFEIPFTQEIELSIFDILGRKVKTLFEGTAPAGIMAVDFNAENLASGIYIYRLKTKDFLTAKKLMLMK